MASNGEQRAVQAPIKAEYIRSKANNDLETTPSGESSPAKASAKERGMNKGKARRVTTAFTQNFVDQLCPSGLC